MKKAIILAAAFSGVLLLQAQAADLKIGIVNLAKCFEDYYKTKQADATLKEAGEAYLKERQQLINDFTKLTEERQKLVDEAAKPELSAEKKAEKQKEADAKLGEIRKQKEDIENFERVRRKQLDDNRRRMQGNIVQEITEQVNKIAKARNFTLVFDGSGVSMNTTPLVVYSEDSLDITLDVIRELNRNQPPPEPKPSGGSTTNEPAAK